MALSILRGWPTALFTIFTVALASVAHQPGTNLQHRATDNNAPNFSFAKLYELQTGFLDNFLSPKNAQQVCRPFYVARNLLFSIG